MNKLLLALMLCIGMIGPAVAAPRISPKQDFQCGLETWGLRISKELDAKVEKKINSLEQRSLMLFGKAPKVIWGYGLPESWSAAGVAYSWDGFSMIIFNPLYANKYKEEFIEVIVTHEYAHAVASMLFPGYRDDQGGHGKPWQGVMMAFGMNSPDRYHQYTLCAEDDGRIRIPFLL